MTGSIKVFLADDHAILREGLKHILSKDGRYEIVGEAGDGMKALEEIERLKPDICVIDISMPMMTGIDLVRKVKKHNSGIKLIILSRHDNLEYVEQALKNGADGYVLKEYAGDELLRAVKEVINGNVYLSPRIIGSVTRGLFRGKNSASGREGENNLTNREKEVLKLVAESRSNLEIAEILRISPKTVKVHRLNIMNKLDIHNVADLVKYAIKNGLIEL